MKIMGGGGYYCKRLKIIFFETVSRYYSHGCIMVFNEVTTWGIEEACD